MEIAHRDRRRLIGLEKAHIRRFKTVRPHLSPHDLTLEQCRDDLEFG
jgi:hypothetical protein